MMAYSTINPVTATVTPFNPYLPAIGRVYEVLLGSTPGEPIQITNREIAERAGVSAGYVPTLLRRLEADGMIERVTTAGGSLILVLDRSDMRDRLSALQPTDHASLIGGESDDRTETPDRLAERAVGDHACLIPPCTPLYGKHDHKQQQQQQQHASFVSPHPDAVMQRLLTLGVYPSSAAQIRAEQPDLTIAAVDAAWRAAQGRRGVDPIALLTHCLITGQPIYTQEELHERRTANRRATGNGAHQPKRSAGGGAGGGRGRAEQRAAKPAKPTIGYEAWARENLELPVRGA